ncbi:beta-lactamase/transpeptidase-like protein [Globomyces pollinis-pini]|nr:beta-lactamase/transpeptidase-like protein [Globomyces pollinis-pini]
MEIFKSCFSPIPEFHPKKKDILYSPMTVEDKREAAIRRIDHFIQVEMTKRRIPGAVISIVKDGQVLLNKGFGILSMDSPSDLPSNQFTTESLLNQSCLAKSITAGAVSILVHQQKLDWFKSISSYLPEIQFPTEFLTKNVNIVDLLSHRTGIFSHNSLLFGNDGFTITGLPQYIFDHLKDLNTTDEFRNSFIHNNIMYVLVGLIVEKLSGVSLTEFIQSNILTPLKMDSSQWSQPHSIDGAMIPHTLNYDVDDYVRNAHNSEKYAKLKGTPTANKPTFVPTVACGALICSANDAMKWINCLVNNGKDDGGVPIVYDMDIITSVQNPIINFPSNRSIVKKLGYGCGLSISQYEQHQILSSAGGLPGYNTYFAFCSESKFAVYFGTNSDYTTIFLDAPNLVIAELLDTVNSNLFKIECYQNMEEGKEGLVEFVQNTISRHVVGWIKMHPRFEDFLGSYSNELYGQVSISRHDTPGYLYLERYPEKPQTLAPIRKNNYNQDPSGFLCRRWLGRLLHWSEMAI